MPAFTEDELEESEMFCKHCTEQIEHDITKTWVHIETKDRFCAPRSVVAMPDIDSVW